MTLPQYRMPKATRGRERTPKALRAKPTRSARAVLGKLATGRVRVAAATGLSECAASSHRFHCRNVTSRSV